MRNIYLKHKCVANGVNPFQSAFVPSFACICLKQSAMPLYCPVLSSCKRVFTTSTGWRQHACFIIVLKKRVSERKKKRDAGRTEPAPPNVWRERRQRNTGGGRESARFLTRRRRSSSPPLFLKNENNKTRAKIIRF